MKIFSNGYQIFNNEQDARNTILSRIKRSQAMALKYSYSVGEIQEKIKVERKGIRHIFYYYDWITKKCKEPNFNSYSYLEKNIGD